MIKIFRKSILKQFLYIITANLSVVCFGLNVAWASCMLVKLKDGRGTGLPRPITDEEGSWIVSIGVITGLPVHFIMGFLMDKIGRRNCLLLSFVPRLIMAVLLVFATEIWMVIFGRGLDGIADGAIIGTTTTYSSEIASKEIRGALGTFIQISSAFGMLIFFGLAPNMPYFYVNLLYLCICVVVLIPTLFLPESPYYLYYKGRKDQSMKVLINLRDSEAMAQEEIEQYDRALNETEKAPRKLDIFKDKVTLKIIGKVLIMSVLLQCMGYNAVLIYMMTIFQLTHTTVKDEVASIIIGCIQLIACFFTILLVEKLGRKPILIGTLCGIAIGMLGLSTFFYLQQHEHEISGFLNYLPLISMALIIFSFNAGLGPLFWMLVAELFDNFSRALGISISLFTTSIFVFITTKYFVTIINAITAAVTFLCFSVLSVIFAIFIMFFIPETKAKSFIQIQSELGRNFKST